MGARRNGWADAAYVLRRWWGRMVLAGAVTFAVLAAGVLWRPPGYTAAMRLVVVPAAGPDDGRAARNQAELLRDPALVRALEPRLLALAQGGAPGWRGRLGLAAAGGGGGLAQQVSAALQVAALGDTDVVALSLRWPDPAFAAGALGLLVARYQQAADASLAAQARLAAAKAALTAAQGELAAAETLPAEDAAGLDAARGRRAARLLASRNEADGVRLERALAQRRLEATEASFKAGGWVEEADGGAGAAGGAAAVAAPVSGGFAALLDKRQTLLAAGKTDSAAMRAIDREIARVRQENYAFARQSAVSRMAALDDRLAALAATIGDGEAALQELDRRVADAGVAHAALTGKARGVAAARLAVDQAREAAGAGWQAAGVGRVVSQAPAPALADWPGQGMILGVAAGCACLVALAVGLRAEARRLTIERPDDITRKLGIEMLAALEDSRALRVQ